jgi:hypothetical protein
MYSTLVCLCGHFYPFLYVVPSKIWQTWTFGQITWSKSYDQYSYASMFSCSGQFLIELMLVIVGFVDFTNTKMPFVILIL